MSACFDVEGLRQWADYETSIVDRKAVLPMAVWNQMRSDMQEAVDRIKELEGEKGSVG